MNNFKTLGIDKEMAYEFNLWSKSDLSLLIECEYFYMPYISKRTTGNFCNVRVIDCHNQLWWYKKLIGFEFFCKVNIYNYDKTNEIKEFMGVKLTDKKMITFRSFDVKDVIIT